MILTDAEFANLKNYCKIDQDYDDGVLKMIINADEIEIARAIKYGSAPNDYVNEPRFKIALMKQVKEDYYQRGLTADAYRPELVSGINGIVNQLRGELDSEDN
ncbi:head-tail connector protein [Limosilactobacillus fermentum]|uniref:head-tail connector protein n=1 Tax=Limosilactobacillus fermentum TaxID=1613 RepID=UPI00186B61D8|nr:head-tail connector protein [Limosilactobacillus fermentum]MBE4709813.1 phage gp6-like head-tail connector protein [Limosilactobacillus fermentum]